MQLCLHGWIARKTNWTERDPLLANLDENRRQCSGSVVEKTGIVFKSQFPDFPNPPFGLDYKICIRFIKSGSFANETFQRLRSFAPVSKFDVSYMIKVTKSYNIFWLSNDRLCMDKGQTFFLVMFEDFFQPK